MGKNWHKLAMASRELLKQSLELHPCEAWPYIIFADNYASSCSERFDFLLKAWKIDPTNIRCSESLASLSSSKNINKELINSYLALKDIILEQKKYAIPIKYSNTRKKDLEIEICFFLKDDKIILEDANHYNTTLDFIIENDWTLKIGYSHDFLRKNKTFVYGAGSVIIDASSQKIIYTDNRSGHFQPTIEKFNKQIFPFLKRLFDPNKLEIMYFNLSNDNPVACGYLPTLWKQGFH